MGSSARSDQTGEPGDPDEQGPDREREDHAEGGDGPVLHLGGSSTCRMERTRATRPLARSFV